MMGIFKDYRTISKQAHEIGARHDVGNSLATMQAKMEALNNSMNRAATGRAMLEGHACRATVISAQPTGAWVNGGQVTQLDLLVMLAGRPPMSVSTTDIVPVMYLSRTAPGSTIALRVMLDDITDMCIDWTTA